MTAPAPGQASSSGEGLVALGSHCQQGWSWKEVASHQAHETVVSSENRGPAWNQQSQLVGVVGGGGLVQWRQYEGKSSWGHCTSVPVGGGEEQSRGNQGVEEEEVGSGGGDGRECACPVVEEQVGMAQVGKMMKMHWTPQTKRTRCYCSASRW